MLHVRTLRDAFLQRYFNEFEKINIHTYIVFQIDKNITILTIVNTVI